MDIQMLLAGCDGHTLRVVPHDRDRARRADAA